MSNNQDSDKISKVATDLAEIRSDVKHLNSKIDSMIMKMDHTVFTGNGSPGLMQRVAVLESRHEDGKDEKSDKSWVTSGPVIIGGVLLGLASAIKVWLLK